LRENLSTEAIKFCCSSQKGTLIRVHNVVDGKCVAEYRRGSMR